MKRATFIKQACLAAGGIIWMPRLWGHDLGSPGHGEHWILPHVRPAVQPQRLDSVVVERMDAAVKIDGQVARTVLTISLRNPESRQQEGGVLVPVPDRAVLKSFRLEGNGADLQAVVLPRDEARRIYDEIVSRLRDPAILEFAGSAAVKSSVFPVPANSAVRLRLEYEELLATDGDRIDYVLPRSESLESRVAWSIDVDWRVAGGIATVFCPSHEVVSEVRGDAVRVTLAGRINPGALRLSVLRRQQQEAVASFLSHPDDSGQGGWFLLLLAPPAPSKDAPPVHREVTVVIDRSGSMAGEKLDQVRAAALQVIEGLDPHDHFNLIIYNEVVTKFCDRPVPATGEQVRKARDFIQGIRVSGGTNIHGALQAAITQEPVPGAVPIVLFLTDGLPTIGETSEKRIREAAVANNPHKRRIFTFGVGVDVNTPLLSRLADDSRAMAAYVLPKENVEVKVAKVFRGLSGPLLTDPVLKVVAGDGSDAAGRLDELVPARLPDLFSNDQVVVTGRYRGNEPLEFRLIGQSGRDERRYSFTLKPGNQRDAFVPRLWAMRRIAVLTEALRDLGAGDAPGASGVDRNDPRVRELVDEIVRLSTEFGILSEYTAFLARDGEVFRPQAARAATANNAFYDKAVATRSGAGSFNQDWNIGGLKSATNVNPTNRFLNEQLVEEEVANVHQAADRAYYKRGNAWVDSRIANDPGASAAPTREVAIGSREFNQLVDRLVAANRQSCLALGPNLEVVVDGARYQIR